MCTISVIYAPVASPPYHGLGITWRIHQPRDRCIAALLIVASSPTPGRLSCHRSLRSRHLIASGRSRRSTGIITTSLLLCGRHAITPWGLVILSPLGPSGHPLLAATTKDQSGHSPYPHLQGSGRSTVVIITPLLLGGCRRVYPAVSPSIISSYYKRRTESLTIRSPARVGTIQISVWLDVATLPRLIFTYQPGVNAQQLQASVNSE
ncbi:hypothetical protein BD779DRAFT_1601706 [Infundibulicybe gibba]|nr:hypothetical protein BD779DRAFT_1601706 [Infundibulicybe gibba]